MKLGLIFASVCLFALGCDDTPKESKPKPPETSLTLNGASVVARNNDTCTEVQTYRDPKRGVTCYVLLGCDGRGAITCLKLEE